MHTHIFVLNRHQRWYRNLASDAYNFRNLNILNFSKLPVSCLRVKTPSQNTVYRLRPTICLDCFQLRGKNSTVKFYRSDLIP